ncbi:MAG: APH(6) family putative aminoglycoside O-phosphotransferase [Alphaproteobacteria bacterium]|nr:APH(6) family putative aminoglycoside O-phosphotransferase [Alphaproteobacteria bacterium]MBV9905174.1 APH(6) family putative aminoglycoside O-phosphotransferase [Alphaproteobacteria bacterium]
MADILPHLQPHIDRWKLSPDGKPFETHSSWLAPVTHGGKPALLKVFKPNSDETAAAIILRHWGDGACRVYEGDARAIVIERVEPGTSLVDMVETDDDRTTHIWCDVVETLHAKPAPEGWKDLRRCGRSLLDRPYPGHAVLTRELFERAQKEFRDLIETQGPRQHLLHSDLHHANVLNGGERGWLVIDPKGYAGELEFEASSFLHNPTRAYCAPKHLARRVHIVASRLGLDEERLIRWCFAHGVLSAVWSLEDDVFDPIGGIEAANAALQVLGHRIGG